MPPDGGGDAVSVPGIVPVLRMTAAVGFASCLAFALVPLLDAPDSDISAGDADGTAAGTYKASVFELYAEDPVEADDDPSIIQTVSAVGMVLTGIVGAVALMATEFVGGGKDAS